MNHWSRTGRAVLSLALIAACGETPAEPGSALEAPTVEAAFPEVAGSSAAFEVWHQGFEHGTEGWYGAETAGPIGWCGAIERVARGSGMPAPSAGSARAVVSVGACNAFWNGLGVPLGAPWVPGPDLVLFSSSWPASGFVEELDVYLDPAWSTAFGSGNLPPFPNNRIIDFSVTIRQLTEEEPSPFDTFLYYFVPVEAVSGQEALQIFGYRVRQAGWYKFRHVFRDVGGQVQVDFELAARRGGTLFVQPDVQVFTLAGPFKVPFTGDIPTSEYGSGYAWFFDVAFGLELPIDEYRVRRGR